ncbi:MAG: hypothetical protein IPL67_16530 [Ignavibacteria bacterium]|nr:hypothetical protein [Ignavibacteria bacterium]
MIPDDIGVYNVSSPRSDSIYITNCDNGVSIIPKAIIGNLSGNNHSNPFEVRCEIRLDNIVVYSDTLQDTIGAYGSHTLTFSPYVVGLILLMMHSAISIMLKSGQVWRVIIPMATTLVIRTLRL